MTDIQQARAHLETRAAKRREENQKRWAQATEECRRIVDMIIQKYNPARIIQWGSLLNPEAFDEMSDIDLAVEGLVEAERYFALLGDAMEMSTFKLDLVQLEKIEPEFAEIIKMKGQVIL
jgi:predicted nucleotidyltransferase